MLSDVYNKRILELAAQIPRIGRLGNPDATAVAHSRLCGSKVTVDLVMQGDLAPTLKQAIRDAFLNLNNPELLRNFRVEGFAPTTDAAYDVLRETARILNLDLSRMS